MVSGLEKLDSNPGELIPEELRQAGEGNAVKIDLNRPMSGNFLQNSINILLPLVCH